MKIGFYCIGGYSSVIASFQTYSIPNTIAAWLNSFYNSSTVFCSSEKCLLHEMTGADFLAYLESSPKTKDALLNMCRKRLFKKAVKKYSMEHNRGFTNDDLTKAFQLADADGNGILDINEIRKVMHAMDPSIPEAEIVELMKFIDVDNDGSLSFRVSFVCLVFIARENEPDLIHAFIYIPLGLHASFPLVRISVMS